MNAAEFLRGHSLPAQAAAIVRLEPTTIAVIILLFKNCRLLFHLARMNTEKPAYKRIVLKLSGEALQERGGARKYFARRSCAKSRSASRKCIGSGRADLRS